MHRTFIERVLIFAVALTTSLKAQQVIPLELSLKRAIDIALAPDGNLRLRMAREFVRQAQFRAAQARAALLPNLDASVVEQSQTRNLVALGIRIRVPIPGFNFPEFVGPFNTFDARATATQSVFDLGIIRRYQASRIGLASATADEDATKDLVARQVAALYYGALRAEASVEAAKADVALAEALLDTARNQKKAGTGTALEVTRAEVQLSYSRQRLLVAENGSRQARLQLLKAMGLSLDTEVRFSSALTYKPAAIPAVEQALATALRSRADLRAQLQREESTRLSYSGVKMERLPSLAGFADYGSIGTGIQNALPTRTYGLALRVPVFDGGRRDARMGESRVLYEQERLRTTDLRQQIELELRLAIDNLRSAEDQVRVSEVGLAQAKEELDRARRRYEAGMANSLEVTDAQTRLARARDNRIAALDLYNQARVDLGQAMGIIRQMVVEGDL